MRYTPIQFHIVFFVQAFSIHSNIYCIQYVYNILFFLIVPNLNVFGAFSRIPCKKTGRLENSRDSLKSITLPKTIGSPRKIGLPNRKFILQTCYFQGISSKQDSHHDHCGS